MSPRSSSRPSGSRGTLSRRRLLQALGGGLSTLALGRSSRAAAEAGGGVQGLLAAAEEARVERALFAGAPDLDDPLELLYSRRISFDEGQPLITVRVLEGRSEVVVRALGPFLLFARSAAGKPEPVAPAAADPKHPRHGKRAKPARASKAHPAPHPPGKYTLQIAEGRPGMGATWVELEQVRYADKAGRDAARSLWEARGLTVRLAQVGDLYGIAGHVVDTRRFALLAQGDATEEGAQAQARQLADRWGIRPQLYRELAARPRGRIALLDEAGRTVAVGQGALELRAEKGLAVERVEYGMGYAFHGFERRVYQGRLFACADAQGKLGLVAALPMERLVKGVVPSEIFATAHLEALKAQAVTARGEVLAKVGARHLGDPYLLCAEQHCQVYKGLSAELPSTDRAVDATAGEALFARAEGSEPRRLVDSVYSAVCGGFTEDNDAVWGGPADPSLRGRPDFPAADAALAEFQDGIGDALVQRFVAVEPMPSYCALSGMAPKDKVRWRRSFTLAEVDALCAKLDVGEVSSLSVEGRGVSGRARALVVEGSRGSARIVGELNIRKQFRMLPSGMFVVTRAGDRWLLQGGGWGHGSGMCQTGAIGRAQRGFDYRQILAWYYSGATSEKIY